MVPVELKTSDNPTVNDIARVAGVSLATVDRVLNGRPGVRSSTVEKVQKAIAELGYGGAVRVRSEVRSCASFSPC